MFNYLFAKGEVTPELGATEVTAIFTDMTETIIDILLNVLPVVLAVVAGLIGLAFGIRWIKRHIGQSR